MESQNLMNTKELAVYLNLNKHTIYRKVMKGEIPCKRVGGRGAIRFDKKEVDAYLNREKKTGDSK